MDKCEIRMTYMDHEKWLANGVLRNLCPLHPHILNPAIEYGTDWRIWPKTNVVFKFNSRETYLAWRLEWKKQYAQLSSTIRTYRARCNDLSLGKVTRSDLAETTKPYMADMAMAQSWNSSVNCYSLRCRTDDFQEREKFEEDFEKVRPRHIANAFDLSVVASFMLTVLEEAKIEANRQVENQKQFA